MTSRTAARVVGAVIASAVAVLVVGAGLFALNRSTGRTDAVFSFADLVQELASAVGFLFAGAVVAARRPRNAVGWLCLAMGLLGTLAWAAVQYAAYGLVTHPGSLPGGLAIAVTTQAGFAPALLLVLLVVVLFPDGRLLSPRWRVVPGAAIAGLGTLFVVGMTGELSAPFGEVANPLQTSSPAVTVTVALALPLALVGVIGAFASVATRFRRSKGDEREQLKWLVLVALFFPLGVVAHALAESFAPGAVGAVEFAFSLAALALPLAIGVAILKYRLYEVDRLISRTLVYASLTVVLGLAYAGLVLAGQALFSSFAGGSNLAIAASTLVVAALFLPLRGGLQTVVDRRFYRSRYDARHTLEELGLRLREQVDPDGVARDVLRAVVETMQPASASLWLNTTGERENPVTIP